MPITETLNKSPNVNGVIVALIRHVKLATGQWQARTCALDCERHAFEIFCRESYALLHNCNPFDVHLGTDCDDEW